MDTSTSNPITGPIATVPGYPRIGTHREVKKALEAFWAGKITAGELVDAADAVRDAGWATQATAGLDLLPVNDFSFYDQVLDTIGLFGAVPARYGWSGDTVDMDTYFAMARGRTGDHDVPAMEMTKWFDTNYHNIVPELGPETVFRIAGGKPAYMLRAAQERGHGHRTKVVLLGPVTFLALAKPTVDGFDPLTLLDRLLPLYTEVVKGLATGSDGAQGAAWIQIDEPILVTDYPEGTLAALERAYAAIAAVKGDAKVIVQTYFDHVGESYETLVNLPVDGIGLDLVRGRKNLDLIAEHGFPKDKILVAGVVDGRNVWINDLTASFDTLTALAERVGAGHLHVSTSCSLQHVPYDVSRETGIDPEIRSWLAFAEQKLAEVVLLAKGLREGRDAIAADLDARSALLTAASQSPKRRNPAVQERLAALPANATDRALPYAERAAIQQERLHLPLLPTTTIGSFPQTPELRVARRKADAGELSQAEYEAFLEGQIRDVIAHQEALGIDVLVHGEPERNDMVQYFGEQLDGFAFTQQGWVQSYGSRYVRPPVIVGDVSRPRPMTVRWATFAQSLSDKPVKGMLTGPVTILNWSFVRDDQPREVTCKQIALAIRDEVSDLEQAGIAIIQIDEAALREGLPLHRADWGHYLDWAVASFRITAAGAAPETQVHTHMCYSEFGDIFGAISDLDADVISIENARSGLELLRSFREQGYDKGVGPGVYDIHSPRVPPVDEIARNLEATLSVLDRERVWVNPDCGLKTRKAPETEAALRNMVEAAQQVRATIGDPVPAS
ncbi:MAG TPA: 5-methyltetrahydropteroyltriglutamate--homocysteine S-methyltransferase [Thermomicrobiales bacterium]|nr:5-methyltetrahydropteroyltriglutamate--homocysteine S-methyltransferase [Thermomicrobiales bacterium]